MKVKLSGSPSGSKILEAFKSAVSFEFKGFCPTNYHRKSRWGSLELVTSSPEYENGQRVESTGVRAFLEDWHEPLGLSRKLFGRQSSWRKYQSECDLEVILYPIRTDKAYIEVEIKIGHQLGHGFNFQEGFYNLKGGFFCREAQEYYLSIFDKVIERFNNNLMSCEAN